MPLLLVAALVCVAVVAAASLAAGPGRLVRVLAGVTRRPPWDTSSERARDVARAAEAQVGGTVRYDASYATIAYPGGDVPIERGACSDVVVRAFRDVGVDLQVEVHEDMSAAFDEYPKRWSLTRPDPNIDHRRVPNLRRFFERKGASLPVTGDGSDYLPGDVVTWSIGGKTHTGIVSTRLAPGGRRYCIVHNIGRGAKVEDRLFDFEITGRYRYFPQ